MFFKSIKAKKYSSYLVLFLNMLPFLKYFYLICCKKKKTTLLELLLMLTYSTF